MQGYVKTLTLKVRVIYITEAVDVIYISSKFTATISDLSSLTIKHL